MLIIDIKTGQPTKEHKYQMVAYRPLAKENITDIEFDSKKHEYKKEGVVIPSVTQAISMISDWNYGADTTAADRGTFLHKCCEMSIKGILDFKNISLESQNFVIMFEKFLKENDLTLKNFESEKRYYSKRYNYAGTVDYIFPEYPKNELWLLYLKENSYKIKKVKYTKELFNDFLCMLRVNQIKKN